MIYKYLIITFATIVFFLSACRPEPKVPDGNNLGNESSSAAHERVQKYIDSVFLTNSAEQDSSYSTKQIYEDAKLMSNGIKGDSTTPELLFKAGALVKGRKDPAKAIGIWSLISEKYPDSKWVADAMFQKAFTFDNDLHDKQLAKKYYEDFLKAYPNHKLAEDIKLLIPTLDKTDAQLIEEFERKNRK